MSGAATRLAHHRLGAGPPLLLLHPLGADRQVWEPVLELLARRREVVAVDLPGFGGSPPVADSASAPADLARAVDAFARSIGLERPHVAGNSLGGWIALELALAGRARSVTAIAPAGLWPAPLMPKRGIARGLARASLPLVPRLAATARGRALLLAGTVARPELVPPSAAAALVRAYATAPGFAAANAAMRASRFAAIEHIRVPVTLAFADRDRLVTPPAHLPPTVRTRVLRDCGHIPMWDDPAQVAAVLLAGSSREAGHGPWEVSERLVETGEDFSG